jgi:hypothetical protein
MSLPVTVVMACVALALLGYIVVRPLRAVREDRDLVAEERGWLKAERFPSTVERLYRHPRLLLTDGPRLRELGYAMVERRTVRMGLTRQAWVVWKAVRPPAAAAESKEIPPRP